MSATPSEHGKFLKNISPLYATPMDLENVRRHVLDHNSEDPNLPKFLHIMRLLIWRDSLVFRDA